MLEFLGSQSRNMKDQKLDSQALQGRHFLQRNPQAEYILWEGDES